MASTSYCTYSAVPVHDHARTQPGIMHAYCHLGSSVRDGGKSQPQSNEKTGCICEKHKPVLDQRAIYHLTTCQAQYAGVRDRIEFLQRTKIA